MTARAVMLTAAEQREILRRVEHIIRLAVRQEKLRAIKALRPGVRSPELREAVDDLKDHLKEL